MAFLGNIILENGHAISPKKEAAIRSWKTPTSLTQLRSFLGTCNFLKRFTPHLSDSAAPLYAACGKSSFSWSDKLEAAFQLVKSIMLSSTILRHMDPSKLFVLLTDTSKFAIASVLLQEDNEGFERLVGYFSQKMDSHKLNYMIYEKELLAAVELLLYWQHHLQSARHPFIVCTDHKALTYY